MPDASWPPGLAIPVGLVLVFLFGGLVALGALTVVLARRFGQMRQRNELRLGELARRLQQIESRYGAPATESSLERSAKAVAADHSSARSALTADCSKQVPGRPTLISVPDLAAASHDHALADDSGMGERHAEIWALAAAGASAQEIARQTGQPIGQVELIVGLYRRSSSHRGTADHARSG
jgi:hypothetical protein